jgi:hypothetical protein
VTRRPVGEGGLPATAHDGAQTVPNPAHRKGSRERIATHSGPVAAHSGPATVAGALSPAAAAAALVAASSGAGPGNPLGSLIGLVQVPGRLLGAPRVRGIAAIDVIAFTAACPNCGRDVTWIEEREETRLRISVECPCRR